MSHDQNLKTIADITLGAGGLTSPAWLPMLHSVNEFAASVAAIGGAILVIIRLYFAFLAWRTYRRNGKLPAIAEE